MECISEFYPESDDTYLIMDSISKDLTDFPFNNVNGLLTVEVGPGSGVVSKHFLEVSAQLKMSVFHIAVDVNVRAAEETRRISDTECIVGDIFTCFRPAVGFDVIISNPPYVPSSPINGARDIRASYAGGVLGREFIDRFLPTVSNRLLGRFYFLLEKRNNVEQVCLLAREQYGLKSELILDRRIPGEYLYVYKFHH